jgi:hypothetical protein
VKAKRFTAYIPGETPIAVEVVLAAEAEAEIAVAERAMRFLDWALSVDGENELVGVLREVDMIHGHWDHGSLQTYDVAMSADARAIFNRLLARLDARETTL